MRLKIAQLEAYILNLLFLFALYFRMRTSHSELLFPEDEGTSSSGVEDDEQIVKEKATLREKVKFRCSSETEVTFYCNS